jgi:hypothetical protein
MTSQGQSFMVHVPNQDITVCDRVVQRFIYKKESSQGGISDGFFKSMLERRLRQRC